MHNAHLALARQALADLALDELRWLPAGDPWQKARRITPAAHREAMVALVMAEEPRFVLDPRELRRSGPSYTLDTVRGLRAEWPDAQLFLVIGGDQLAGLHTWQGWRELLVQVTLAVAGRPGAPDVVAAEVAAAWREAIALPPMALSATDIRARVAAGQDVSLLVPPAVAGYIARHDLYRD